MSRVLSRAAHVARIGVLGLAAAIAFTAVTTQPADARRRSKAPAYNPPYASIVVDANSGKTLQATNADSIRYPASLTKIMTLYLLFERLESGRIKLDSEMEVSAHAAKQPPTKLGLRDGGKLTVEDAIKGLITKSANDAAVVVAEALAGSEEKFAQMMTQKARALGMIKTVYRNASGLPDTEQVTTAREQALLGRAIQDRFPRYYAYFATPSFRYRGNVIRGHNRLIGRVEGVDGIKTGYTRASGFNLVTSMKRGNRYVVAVVLGGRSAGSRDTAMRNLLAQHVGSAATKRTVAAITEHAPGPKLAAAETRTPLPLVDPRQDSGASAAAPAQAAHAKQEPVLLPSGVVAAQSLPPVPGSSDPITPTRVKTLQVRAGAVKTASAASGIVPVPLPPTPPAQIQTSSIARGDLPQPANHGTGQGILGTLPASALAYADTTPDHVPAPVASAPAAPAAKPVAVAAATPAPAAAPAAPTPAAKPVVRSGWIVQVGAFDAESEARQRLDEARARVKQLSKADPFTEPVSRGDKTMYRARFAGLGKTDAEAACKALKRNDIACFTIRN